MGQRISVAPTRGSEMFEYVSLLRHKRELAILLFVGLLIGFAEGFAQSDTLTIDRAIQFARARNVRLSRAESSLRSVKLSHDELLTTRLPQIRLTASSIYAPASGHFGYDPALSNGGQFGAQIVVQQSLYDGGIRSLRSEQISVDIDRLNKEYRLSERDLVFSVKQAFIEALRSEQEIRLQAESVGQLTDYLVTVRQLSKGGNANYTDVLKTELQLSNAQISYQKSLESYSTAKYTLADILGAAIDTSFNVAGKLDDSTGASIDSLAHGQTDPVATLEMSIAALSVQRTQLDMELTRLERAPTFSLIGDAGLLTSRDNLRVPYDERSGIFGYSLGVFVEVPLVNWGATDLRVQQRQLAVDDLRFQSELLHRSIFSETKKTQLQLVTLRERLHSIRDSYKSAEENFLLTKSKFAGGGALSLEVLSAQQLLTDTRLSELQTLADIQLLTARLEQLTTR